MIDFWQLFGLHLSTTELKLVHLTVRAFFVYICGMFLVRLQSEIMSIDTPFNFMLNFILGSLLANAIVGEGSYFHILGMCFFIALLNLLIAIACYYSRTLEAFFKGRATLIVKDGKIIWKHMRKNFITKDELMEAVRRDIHSESLDDVKRAYCENDGQITIVKK